LTLSPEELDGPGLGFKRYFTLSTLVTMEPGNAA
jgi:hypothetical protein